METVFSIWFVSRCKQDNLNQRVVNESRQQFSFMKLFEVAG
jgi:hypothetical protein